MYIGGEGGWPVKKLKHARAMRVYLVESSSDIKFKRDRGERERGQPENIHINLPSDLSCRGVGGGGGEKESSRCAPGYTCATT